MNAKTAPADHTMNLKEPLIFICFGNGFDMSATIQSLTTKRHIR